MVYIHGHAACVTGGCPMYGVNQAECCDGETFASCPVPTSDVAAGPSATQPARTDERAFRIVSAGGMTHIDPLTSADRSPGMGPAWYDLLAAWLRLHFSRATLAPRRG